MYNQPEGGLSPQQIFRHRSTDAGILKRVAAQANHPGIPNAHLRQAEEDLDNFHAQSRSLELAPFAYVSAISGTFNSLSKVLFTFPSRYLFTIGLGLIFSFRRNLPPN